jgi:transcriptional regulator with XRE-family HTH domain
MTLRELRERRGFHTTARLAEKANLPCSRLTKIENGKVADPRHSTVKALVKALRVSMTQVERAISETVRLAA